MVPNWLVERGQSFLSRSNSNSSRNRKSTIASRHKNSILSSQQNDSSATALPTHGTEQNNNNSNTRLSSGLPGTQVSTNQNKGAADFQVRGIGIDPIPRTSTPSVTAGGGGNTAAGAGMTTPPSHRHHSFAHQRGMSEDGAIFSGDNTPRRTPRQRTRKLVRDPRNTHHMKYTGGSQSMDINPSHRAVDHEKVGLFTQLFSCCTPVTGMFKRGASYGSVRNDPRAPSIQQQNRQSNDNVSVTHEQMEEPQVLHGNVNYNRRRQRRHPQQGHPSVTDTAVGPGSAHGGDDDGSLSTTKSSSATPANEQQRVEEVAAEGDWLMRGSSANNNNNSNNDNEDYTSPGSGFVGGFAVPVSSSRHQTLQQQRSSAAAAVATNASDSNNNLPAVNASTALSSELSAYASAYSEFSSTTDAEATSSMGNSAYRTAPTSIGDITSTSSGGGGGGDNNQRRQGSHAATTGSNDSSGSSSGGDGGRMVRGRSDSFGNTTHSSGPSDTPSNTFSKLYLDDEAYEHVPRKLTVESRSSGGDAEVVDSEGLDSDDENDLRSEITSPVGNIATESSERLVTHVINQYLLPPISARLKDRKCLVLDLDETLVHSSFREVENPDYVVPVVLEGQEHNVYVVKRPGVDEFMRVMGQYYEIVVFTASLSMVSMQQHSSTILEGCFVWDLY